MLAHGQYDLLGKWNLFGGEICGVLMVRDFYAAVFQQPVEKIVTHLFIPLLWMVCSIVYYYSVSFCIFL